MSTTTSIPALIDYMVATAKASTTLGARPVSPVSVFDGPTVMDSPPPFALWIGMDEASLLPGGTDYVIAATGTQLWVGPGNRLRDEAVTIHCVADSWSGGGETDMSIARNQTVGIMSAFEESTRADANQGGRTLFTNPGVTNATWYQMQVSGGSRVMVGFDFVCFSRIGSNY